MDGIAATQCTLNHQRKQVGNRIQMRVAGTNYWQSALVIPLLAGKETGFSPEMKGIAGAKQTPIHSACLVSCDDDLTLELSERTVYGLRRIGAAWGGLTNRNQEN